MKISIAGPGKFEAYEKINPRAKTIIAEIAKLIAESGNEIVLTPDKNSAIAFFAKEYQDNGGKKVYEIVPLDDKEFGYEKYLDITLGEIINCGTWINQAIEFNKNSDMMICLAYGWGTMVEIHYAEHYNPKTVYIIKEFITSELPKELHKNQDIKYVSYKELINILKSSNKK